MWAFRCVHPTKLFLLQNTIANKLNLFRRSPGYKERTEFQREQKEGGELVGGRLAVECVDGNWSLAMAVIKGKLDGEESACSRRCARRRR